MGESRKLATSSVEESMAFAYHTLSSYGWFEEPVLPSNSRVVGDLSPRPDSLDGTEADTLIRLLSARVSQRSYGGAPIDSDALAQVLWCCYGITAKEPVEQHTVPSAGGTYGLRLLILTPSNGRLQEFDPSTAGLIEGPGPIVESAELWALFRTRHVQFDQASSVLLFAARWEPALERYGERGYRYLLLEAGHAAQNACLAATALGIGHVPLGGFDDDRAAILLAAHKIEATVLYALALGTALV